MPDQKFRNKYYVPIFCGQSMSQIFIKEKKNIGLVKKMFKILVSKDLFFIFASQFGPSV